MVGYGWPAIATLVAVSAIIGAVMLLRPLSDMGWSDGVVTAVIVALLLIGVVAPIALVQRMQKRGKEAAHTYETTRKRYDEVVRTIHRKAATGVRAEGGLALVRSP
jgi:hypothetical protein